MRRSVMCLIACSILSGQEPGTAFEVASVKFDSAGPMVIPPGQVGFARFRPVKLVGDRISAVETLYELIRLAYQLGPHEIAGPAWLSDRRYEVTAIVPPGTTKEAVPVMLRHLLAERLGLKTHWEERVRPVRALLVAETGHKLIEAEGEEKKEDVKIAGMTIKASHYRTAGRFFSAALDLDILAEYLSGELKEPVMNATRLDKRYRVDAHWTPNPRQGFAPGSHGSDSEYPQALLKQLGLRLEKQRLPTKMLVVDHANLLPTAN
jgi:uncharacterized protein (TIGR03435 family)